MFQIVNIYFALRSPETGKHVENLSSAAVECLFVIILSLTCHVSLWSFVKYKSKETYTAEYLRYSNEEFFLTRGRHIPNKTDSSVSMKSCNKKISAEVIFEVTQYIKRVKQIFFPLHYLISSIIIFVIIEKKKTFLQYINRSFIKVALIYIIFFNIINNFILH